MSDSIYANRSREYRTLRREAARARRERATADKVSRGCDASRPLVCDISIQAHPEPAWERLRSRCPAPIPADPRTAMAFETNVKAFISRYGEDHVVLLTLTFSESLTSTELQRRWNSLATNVIKPIYGQAVVVREHGKRRGKLHIHCLLPVPFETCRMSCDFEAIERGDTRTACKELKAQWKYWRELADKYGLDGTQLLPLRKDAMSVSRYLSKELRQPHVKGERIRRVSYIGCDVSKVKGAEARRQYKHKFTCTTTCRFSWANGRAKEWRQKVKGFVQMMADSDAITAPTDDAMKVKFGAHWMWQHRADIESFPLDGGPYTKPPTYEQLRAECAAARTQVYGRRVQ
jgi:hypothetical protein